MKCYTNLWLLYSLRSRWWCFYYSATVGVLGIEIGLSACLSVCLSVILSTWMYPEPRDLSAPNFLCIFRMALAGSSSDSVAISIVLPVSSMTLCLGIRGRIAYFYYFNTTAESDVYECLVLILVLMTGFCSANVSMLLNVQS